MALRIRECSVSCIDESFLFEVDGYLTRRDPAASPNRDPVYIGSPPLPAVETTTGSDVKPRNAMFGW